MRMIVSRAKNSDAGLGLGSVLQVIFIVLKLCGLIDWSWWWVMSPTWISIGILIVGFVVIVFARFFLDKRGRYYL